MGNNANARRIFPQIVNIVDMAPSSRSGNLMISLSQLRIEQSPNPKSTGLMASLCLPLEKPKKDRKDRKGSSPS